MKDSHVFREVHSQFFIPTDFVNIPIAQIFF